MSTVQQRLLTDNQTSSAEWLDRLRQNGREAWLASAWPTRKTEAWKYTSLRELEKAEFISTQECGESTKGKLPDNNLSGLDAYVYVFIDGQFNAALSELAGLPKGVSLVAFREASADQAKTIQEKLNGLLDANQNVFASLNNANLQDGVFLHLEAGVVCDKPILVLHQFSGSSASTQCAPRLLAILEKSAGATVIEQFLSEDENGENFACGLTELYVGENAQLEHYRLHLEEGQAIHIGGVHVGLQRNARFNSFHCALGSRLKRVDLVVHHQGEGAECIINGVYLPQDGHLVDYHTCIEHAVPQCTTQENFRGIIGGTGRAVFNGRIHIHPNAQKTLAQLNNRNLLTSDKAEVDTKPELEIYADDVQCAHGATVAQLDETSMHYFRTRGISAKEAEVMLSFGFINELLNTAKIQSIADYLRPLLAARFARDAELLRHIV